MSMAYMNIVNSIGELRGLPFPYPWKPDVYRSVQAICDFLLMVFSVGHASCPRLKIVILGWSILQFLRIGRSQTIGNIVPFKGHHFAYYRSSMSWLATGVADNSARTYVSVATLLIISRGHLLDLYNCFSEHKHVQQFYYLAPASRGLPPVS